MTLNTPRSLKLVELNPENIVEDTRYSFSYPANRPALFESVKKTGIIQPLWVTPSPAGDKFNLISGFGRFAAARKFQIETIIALLFEDRGQFEMFLMSVEENSFVRSFNQVELSFIVLSAVENFNKSFNELADVLFPLLGLSKSRNIYNWLLDLARFGPAAHSLIARLKMPLGPARALGDFGADDREAICLWLTENNFGLSKSVKLIEVVSEICGIEKISVNAVIQDVETAVPVEMEPPQRNEKLFSHLIKRRNPLLAEMQSRFNSSVRDLKLPSGIKVNPPKNFEGRSLDFVIKAGDAKRAVMSANAIIGAGELKLSKLFDWI